MKDIVRDFMTFLLLWWAASYTGVVDNNAYDGQWTMGDAITWSLAFVGGYYLFLALVGRNTE